MKFIIISLLSLFESIKSAEPPLHSFIDSIGGYYSDCQRDGVAVQTSDECAKLCLEVAEDGCGGFHLFDGRCHTFTKPLESLRNECHFVTDENSETFERISADARDFKMLLDEMNTFVIDELGGIDSECISNDLRSCMDVIESETNITQTILTNSCQNMTLTQESIDSFEHFMTTRPWLIFTIDSILSNQDLLISVYLPHDNAQIIDFYKYLAYIQYTSSNISFYGTNEEIWFDFVGNCLMRYFGSLYTQLIHGFEHSLIQSRVKQI